MKTTRKTLLALSATALLASLAFAQTAPGTGALPATPQGRALSIFNAADTDKDGALTLDEATRGMPGMAARFAALDTDHDGKVTQTEFQAMQNATRGQLRGAMRGAYAGTATAPAAAQGGWGGRMGGGGRGMGAGRGGMMPVAGMGIARADLNGDGVITRDEVGRMGIGMQQRFDAVDTDKDGKVTVQELTAGCPIQRL